MKPMSGSWLQVQDISAREYVCGYCRAAVASEKGWSFNLSSGGTGATIRICPMCRRPTFFEQYAQNPAVPFGSDVRHLPEVLEGLFDESRRSCSVCSYTAAVLCCRKMLMHIAVDLGAKPDQAFIQYVEYLANNGYVPPNGKGWVDHIRKKGNEANHEIVVMAENDAKDLVTFVEMLLKFIYEFPNRVPSP